MEGDQAGEEVLEAVIFLAWEKTCGFCTLTLLEGNNPGPLTLEKSLFWFFSSQLKGRVLAFPEIISPHCFPDGHVLWRCAKHRARGWVALCVVKPGHAHSPLWVPLELSNVAKVCWGCCCSRDGDSRYWCIWLMYCLVVQVTAEETVQKVVWLFV